MIPLRTTFLMLISVSMAATAQGQDAGSADEYPITESERDHWSFLPINQPQIPAVQQTEWVKNPIDNFVLAKLETKKLRGLPAASQNTLLRRVSFDLIGTPPPSEIIVANDELFVAQDYEAYVDALLAQPGYGERWAQHWLDLARFAETDGFEHDKVRPEAWEYRQWIIDAFNSDMPYDEFVRQQIAGDLDDAPRNDIATMFCLAGADMPDINEQDLRRHDKLNEITSTVGSALLGLQMHCAQCHDHKYDPISIGDFYRLRGIFESSVPSLVRDRGVSVLATQADPIKPFVYRRGELTNRTEEVLAKPPRIACWDSTHADFDSSNPRPAFVQWMFDRSNSLVARVIVNRVWQHHFGRSLTENPSDFGTVESGPSHPELLDWLAIDLMDHEWSLKHLHRLILTSSTYQQSGHFENIANDRLKDAFDVDPRNSLYSRFPRIRLEGEVVRDTLIKLQGKLDSRYGGKSVQPPLPNELMKTLLEGQWITSAQEADHYRRSIYVFARRNLRYPIFEAFDRPDAGASCPIRNQTTTAIQSLELLNSELANATARGLAAETLRDFDQEMLVMNPEPAIHSLYKKCYSRNADPSELKAIKTLIFEDRPIEKSLTMICLALLNSNEFIYVD